MVTAGERAWTNIFSCCNDKTETKEGKSLNANSSYKSSTSEAVFDGRGYCCSHVYSAFLFVFPNHLH